MFYLALFLIAIPSPVLVIFNAEVIAIVLGLAGVRPWPLVATSLALGQTVGFLILYAFGERIFAIPWIARKRQKVDLARFRKQSVGWLGVAAIFGLPPLTVLSSLSSLVAVRWRTLLVVTVLGRWVRFAVLAGLPALFSDWIPAGALPEFLTQWQ